MTEEATKTNMRIWTKVCKTDPRFTRPFIRNGKTFHDVNPQYRLQVLTELFGPAGMEWGWTISERWIDTWGSVQCAYVRLAIWYVDENGTRCETPEQIGGTIVGENPDEIWKMSITDAVGKCCAMLGISADVYLGVFDSKYRREMDEKTQPSPHFAAPPAPKPAPATKPPVSHNPQSIMQQQDSDVPF